MFLDDQSSSTVNHQIRFFCRRFMKRRGEGVFSYSSPLARMSFITHEVRSAFLTPFSFAKVQRLSSMPSTAPDGRYSWQKSRSSLPQIAVTIWVFREIFTEIPWRRPQRKGTKSETKSMTTDKEKTHGRLDKNLKDRDLSSLSR